MSDAPWLALAAGFTFMAVYVYPDYKLLGAISAGCAVINLVFALKAD